MSSKEIGTKAATQAGSNDDVKFSERLNLFMHANRKLFISLGVLILAGVVITGVVSMVSADALRKSTVALEAIEMDFEAWSKLEEAEKVAGAAKLVASADELTAKYRKQYAGARALMLKAEVLKATNDFTGAEKAWAELASTYPDQHTAPVALANAAALAEDRGDIEAALSYLARADELYPTAPGIGRVVLSIGRLYETTKQYDKAMETYTRLIASGVESDWTKIAHDRIILIKSLGLAQ